jgi:hypothetical protein
MKRFVIFGDIEFFDGDSALIHRVHSAEYIADGDIEAKAAELNNCDFLSPHDYKGGILFMQYPKEVDE